jgi:hypothetical protein
MITKSRYNEFINDGKCEYVPFIEIPKQASDYYVMFDNSKMRLDILSYQYYDNPNYGWVILQANPEYGSLEFLIPSGTVLRIPYPIENVLNMYNENVKKYKQIYGDTK